MHSKQELAGDGQSAMKSHVGLSYVHLHEETVIIQPQSHIFNHRVMSRVKEKAGHSLSDNLLL